MVITAMNSLTTPEFERTSRRRGARFALLDSRLLRDWFLVSSPPPRIRGICRSVTKLSVVLWTLDLDEKRDVSHLRVVCVSAHQGLMRPVVACDGHTAIGLGSPAHTLKQFSPVR